MAVRAAVFVIVIQVSEITTHIRMEHQLIRKDRAAIALSEVNGCCL